jgi:uncharacterized protein YnzC (UPF0291/DUF896 family)
MVNKKKSNSLRSRNISDQPSVREALLEYKQAQRLQRLREIRHVDFRNSLWHNNVTTLISETLIQNVECNSPLNMNESVESGDSVEKISNHAPFSRTHENLPGMVENDK